MLKVVWRHVTLICDPLCSEWQNGADGAGWLNASGFEGGLVGGELIARWWYQRHMDFAVVSQHDALSKPLLRASLSI